MSFLRYKHAIVCSALAVALLTATLSSQAIGQVLVTPTADESASIATQSASSLPPPDEANVTSNVQNADAAAVLPAETEPNISPDVATHVEQAYGSQPRRFHYTFDVTGSAIYDDNINLQHTDRLSDTYFSIDPHLVFGFGDVVGKSETFLRVEYTPSIQLYADHTDLDAFQQVARLEAQHQISRLTLTLDALFEHLDSTYITVFNAGTPADQVNVDVANRTRLDLFSGSVGASYDFSGKTFLSAGASFSASEYDNLISSESFSGNVFLNYRYSSKLTVGLGGGAGRTAIEEPDPDETFEQAGLRIIYQASGKLSFTADAGVEFRQVDSGPLNDSDSFATPVFDANAVYQPFDGTKITLTASRRTLNSAVLAGQDYDATSLSFDVRQRLLRRVTLGFMFSYQNLDYFATTAVSPVERSDDYYSIGPSLDVAITRFWSAGAFYNHRQNSSSLDNFSFDSNQVGFRTSVSF